MAETSRRRGMHPLLAFILGFLLALIIVVGAAAGAVVIALNYKLDKIEANKDAEGNYLFINADPENGGVATVKELVSKITEMSKGYQNLTLGEIEDLIPVMGKVTAMLSEELNNFVTLEDGELKGVTVGGLSEFISGLADRINVAKLIGTTADNAILVYMSYGVYGLKEDGGVWSAKYKDEEGVVHDCVPEFDGEKISGVYYTDGDGEKVYTPYLTLDNVKTRVNGVCEELTIGEIVPMEDNDRILGSIKNSTVNTISNDINNLCIQQIFSNEVYARENADDGNFPEAKAYLAVADETQMQNAAVYGVDIIYYEYDTENLKYVLAGNNGKLSADDFAAKSSLYTLGEGKILFDESFLYYEADEDGDLYMLNAGSENAGRLASLSSGDGYYTYGKASPLWKLLVYVDEKEQAFTFNNVGTMISNVSKNTQETPMRELDAAGILTFSDKSQLEYDIIVDGKVQKLGDTPLSVVVGIFVASIPH